MQLEGKQKCTCACLLLPLLTLHALVPIIIWEDNNYHFQFTLELGFQQSGKNEEYYHSFTVSLGFWLAKAKIPSIIHHNQLLSTKFGRILRCVKNDVNYAAPLYYLREPGDEVELFWRWLQNGRTFHSFHEEEVGELLAKNTAKTARRQLKRWHLPFGEYLQTWITLYLLNLPTNMHYQRWTQHWWR